MRTKKFVTAINCIDGRVQLPIITWMKKQYDVDFVDMITEPGPNKILAENEPSNLIDSLKNRTEISIKKHTSTCIAIVGHFDCAGNPVGREKQIEQIRISVKRIQSWDFEIPVIGLWIDDNWNVSKII